MCNTNNINNIAVFSGLESHLDPRVSYGLGFSWSWTGALVSSGARPPASVTDTHSALRVQSTGSHPAAQGETDQTRQSACVIKRGLT